VNDPAQLGGTMVAQPTQLLDGVPFNDPTLEPDKLASVFNVMLVLNEGSLTSPAEETLFTRGCFTLLFNPE